MSNVHRGVWGPKAPRSSCVFYDHSTCMYDEQRTSGGLGGRAPPVVHACSMIIVHACIMSDVHRGVWGAKTPRSSCMFYDHITCMYHEQRTSGGLGGRMPPVVHACSMIKIHACTMSKVPRGARGAKGPRSSCMFYDYNTCMYYEQSTSGGGWGLCELSTYLHKRQSATCRKRGGVRVDFAMVCFHYPALAKH